ncbi:probable ribonuclease P/MRP protein subunit POP5 [Impatiens glandulifera]|uniref:probable ribonuclease P/MRP protein subunit POP5 n=1 Tax=Impatiens glandulifera TaxID=253017 RepID=UPI001FB11756|nr:probable ribonuclease P/MRP protein subunit POP5 [Impatiens glandulifera]
MVGFKNRYLVMEVFLSPDNGFGIDDLIILTQFNVSKAIKDSLLENFGECGLASSLISFQVKYVNSITKLCVIRASREEHNKVWAAITLVRRIGNCPVLFNLLDLSGSIKACRNAAVKCEEMKFEHYKLVLGDRLKDDNDINQQLKNSLEKIRTLEH